MKITMLMNRNSYAGREYLFALNQESLIVDVITIGDYPDYNSIEEERCGGNWIPPKESIVTSSLRKNHFKSLKDVGLIEFLKVEKYDIGIQGGTGIIRSEVINQFNLGILNFHPGDLPQ